MRQRNGRVATVQRGDPEPGERLGISRGEMQRTLERLRGVLGTRQADEDPAPKQVEAGSVGRDDERAFDWPERARGLAAAIEGERLGVEASGRILGPGLRRGRSLIPGGELGGRDRRRRERTDGQRE